MAPSRFRLALAVAGLAAAALPRADAQQQFDGICATVKIEILQELTVERIGFEATLEVTNNDSSEPINAFLAELYFEDPNQVLEDGSYVDVTDQFFVQAPRLSDVTRIDGTGIIGPTKTGIARWFIIPKKGTGGTDPRGRQVLVGCRLGGTMFGEPVPPNVMSALPDMITVYPEMELVIRYFQPRDVQGDDPFTPEVESPIPFPLGVLVTNEGYGRAKSLKIKSQQPKIVSNASGLLLVAQLLGVRIQDSPLDETSLTVDLGDLEPLGHTRKGVWDMITSLSGEFIEFKASYTHAPDLGGEETSVIKSLEAHFIARECLVDLAGRDAIMDFLADTDRDASLLPDTIYESEGNVLPVNYQPNAQVTAPLAGNQFTLTVDAVTDLWGYVRIFDPGQLKYQIVSVVRNDGKVLNARNTWHNLRYRETDNARLEYFNLLDYFPAPGVYSYVVTYTTPPPDSTPPATRLRFAGEVNEAGGKFYVTRETQMYFTSDDASPVAIQYRLNAEDFRPALPFKLRDPGEYLVTFFAEDNVGNVEAEQTAILVLAGSGPGFAGLDVVEGGLSRTGSVLSFRGDEILVDVTVPASAVGVTAEVDIFQGIRVWPTVSGLPVSPTPLPNATLTVGGENVDFYVYRVNGGAWSAEQSVVTPLALFGLSGAVTVDIRARNANGGYPPAGAAPLSVGWTVDPAAPAWVLTGEPETPTRYQAGSLTVASAGADLYRWTLNNGFFRAEAPLATPIALPVQETGPQTLALYARRGGVWEDEADAATWSWHFDPAYGSDMSALPLVQHQEIPGAEGRTTRIVWNGRDQAGNPQVPGWYTMRIRLVDAIGNFTFRNVLVKIEDITGSPSVLADTAAAPEKPHARGEWLVWQERGSGSPNIKARRLRGTPGPVLDLTASTRNQENPRTDGRWVVWQGRDANGTWDIFAVDLDDPGTVVQVTSTPGISETAPALDWPWVVWQQKDVSNPANPWQVVARNLDTLQEFPVSPPSGGIPAQDQLDPAVQAGRVVWQDFRDVGYGEIYYRDLETGEQRRITTNNFGQYFPDIDGPWVVWLDNRHIQVELYGLDLRRGYETRLTNSPENEGRPWLAGSFVLYNEDSLGVLDDNFRLLDVQTLKVAPLTSSLGRKPFGTMVTDRLVFQEGESGASRLITAEIPGLQPVFVNFNTVAVSGTLAARYGTAFPLLQAWNAAAGVTEIARFTSLVPADTEVATGGAAPAGDDFALAEGDFLWVQFGSAQVIDLGPGSADSVDLPSGISAFSFARFPVGTTGHGVVRSLGLANVRGLRVLDAAAGVWNVLEVSGGRILGDDFRVPTACVLVVDLANPVSDWTP